MVRCGDDPVLTDANNRPNSTVPTFNLNQFTANATQLACTGLNSAFQDYRSHNDHHNFLQYASIAANHHALITNRVTSPQHLYALNTLLLNLLHKQLQQVLAQDKKQFVTAQADKIRVATQQGAWRTAWDTVNFLQASSKKSAKKAWPIRNYIPYLLDETGTPVQSTEHAAQVKQRHFARIEAAEITNLNDLQCRYNSTPSQPIFELNVLNIPSRQFIDNAISHSKPRKQTGPDQSSNDLINAARQPALRHLMPLYLKVGALGQEPLIWKGGTASDILKPGQSADTMKGFRSILLGSHFAKHHHKFLRERLAQLLNVLAIDTQCGGIKHKGTDMANHTVRAFLQLAKLTKTTVAVLFIDIKSAFDSVVRELIMPLITTDTCSADLAERLEIPLALIGPLEALLAKPTFLDTFVDDTHLIAQITDTHTNTWFGVKGTQDIAISHRGTRPGMPLADLIFNIQHAPTLLDIQQRLQQHNLIWTPRHTTATLPIPLTQQANGTCDATFVDDTAVFITPHNTTHAIQDAQVGVSEMVLAMWSRGLLVKFSAGKTELLFSANGPGSHSLLTQLSNDFQGTIPLPTVQDRIRVVG